MQLNAETFGAAGDPAVVLLHGAGQSMMAWDAELCERLAGHGRLVVRVDARDTGRSPRSGPDGPSYSLHDMAGDVIELLDALGLEAATLAGISGGGIVAQIAVVEHPARVSGLVLISSTPLGDDLPGPVEGLFEGGPEQPDWTDRAAAVRYLVEVERPYAGARFDEPLHIRIAERTFDHAEDLAVQLSHPFAVGTGPSVRDRLGEVRVPTAIVHGTADPLFPIEHGRALAAAIPGGTLVELDGFGHATVPRDDWPTLVDLIVAHSAASTAA
jgi:pimeloyl-ACP methyl ester carboxylesterase